MTDSLMLRQLDASLQTPPPFRFPRWFLTTSLIPEAGNPLSLYIVLGEMNGRQVD